MADSFQIAAHSFTSRLLVGTGRYADEAVAYDAILASGAEIVTAAVRRLPAAGASHVEEAPPKPLPPLAGGGREGGATLWDRLHERNIAILPNSAGCHTAEDAVRMLRLGRELAGHDLCKLEVIGDIETLLPDEEETVRAARLLVADGFSVMAYTTASLDIARRLEDAGCAAVMPLAAPIGSGLGLLAPDAIAAIVDALSVPVLVDAGIGAPSDAAQAMELGCDGVLLNTAIAEAGNPVAMAQAFRLAVQAGRLAHEAGRMPRRGHARPSSPPLSHS